MAGVMDVTKVIGAMRAICASQDIHDECESLLWVNLSDPAHSGAADLRDSERAQTSCAQRLAAHQ